MKWIRTSLVLLMFSITLSGSDSIVAAQIIDKVLDALIHEEKVLTWGETNEHLQIIQQSPKMEWTDDPKKAKFLLISKSIPDNISANAIVFTTEYKLLKKEERIIGAFFWQKGRPNLLFLRNRLQEKKLTLGKEFNKYIEDAL